MSDQDTLLRDFELSVYNITKPQPVKMSLKMIEEFKKSYDIFNSVKYILENSKRPDVHFHAIVCLQESVLHHWSRFPKEQISKIKDYLIEYMTRGVAVLSEIPPQAKAKVVQTVAVFMKRTWLSIVMEDHNQVPQANMMVLQQLKFLLTSNSVPVLLVGMAICKELISEYSSSTDSKMSVSWEFHRMAKQNFEASCIQHVFVMVLNTTQQILALGPNERPKAHNLFVLCFELLQSIMSWPFGQETKDNQNEVTTIEPNPSWRDLLVKRFDVLSLFFKLFEEVKNDEKSVEHVVQALVQFASISGEIFEDVQQKQTYLEFFIENIFRLTLASNDPADLLNLCQICNRIAINFSPEMLRNLSRGPRFFFEQITKATCQILGVIRSDPEKRETYENAFDDFLATWVVMVEKDSLDLVSKIKFYQDFCGTIFKYYVSTASAMATCEELPFQDIKLDQIENIAKLGRLAIGTSCSILLGFLNASLTNLHSLAQAKKLPFPEEEMAKMVLLVTLAGFLLVEEKSINKSSLLSIPQALVLFSQQQPLQNDTSISLVMFIFKTVEFENFCIHSKLLDGWFSEMGSTLVWFMKRWCRAYLFAQSSELSPNYISTYGSANDQNSTGPILDFFLKKALVNLFLWEAEEVDEESSVLLVDLSLKPISPNILTKLNGWNQLFEVYRSNDVRISKKSGKVQRKFIETILNFASKTDAEQRNSIFHCIKKLLGETIFPCFYHYIQSITNLTIETETILKNYLENLRGFASNKAAESMMFVADITKDLFIPINELFKKFKMYHSVEITILKYYVDYTHYLFPNLPAPLQDHFLNMLTVMLTTFIDSEFGKWLHKRQSIKAEEEQMQKVTRVLKIAQYLIPANHPLIAGKIYFCVNVVVSALRDAFEYPKVMKTFYTTLGLIFEKYGGKFPCGPSVFVNSIFDHLDLGLNKVELSRYLRLVFKAIENLCNSAVTSRVNGEDPFSKYHEALYQYFPKILDSLISGNIFEPATIERAALVFYSLFLYFRPVKDFNLQDKLGNLQPHQRGTVLKDFEEMKRRIGSGSQENKKQFCEMFIQFFAVYRGMLKRC